MNGELEGLCREVALVTLSYSHGIGMEGLRETVKNLSQLVWPLRAPEHGSHSTAMFGTSQ